MKIVHVEKLVSIGLFPVTRMEILPATLIGMPQSRVEPTALRHGAGEEAA